MKKLIAHYSWSGTTKKAAQKLAKKEGADLLEITVPGHVYELGMRQVADLAISQLENKEYPVIAHDQVPLVSYDQRSSWQLPSGAGNQPCQPTAF